MEKNEYAKMYGLENTYWWYRGLHELIERYVQRHAKKTVGPLFVLDAGCGTGRMLEILGNYGIAEGFDYSEEALNFCKKKRIDECCLSRPKHLATTRGKIRRYYKS